MKTEAVGFTALVGEEQAVLRLHDHDAGRAHSVQFGDRARKFTLQRPQVVRALHKVAQAELAFVEDLESNAVAAREALGGELHAEAIDLVGGDVDRSAPGGDLVGDVLGFQLADDAGGVLLAQAAVKQLVVGSAGPEDQRGKPGHHDHGGEGEGDALVEAKLFPKGKQRLGEGFHENSGGRGGGVR